jgi:hypothetical protein
VIYRLRLKEQALSDINEAFDWYESQREGLGSFFLDEIEKHLGVITGRPDLLNAMDFKESQ